MAGHFDIANFPIGVTVKLVAGLLDSILTSNDRLPNTTVTHFHSRAIPNITVYSYLTRILKFTPFTNEAILSCLIYFDRIAAISAEKQNTFVINSFNIHRLLISSVLVSSKYSSDVFYPNTRYAKVGGLPLAELNQLELEFLFLCNFDLHIRLEDLQEYADQLLCHASHTHPTDPALYPLLPSLHPPTPEPSPESTSHSTSPLFPPPPTPVVPSAPPTPAAPEAIPTPETINFTPYPLRIIPETVPRSPRCFIAASPNALTSTTPIPSLPKPTFVPLRNHHPTPTWNAGATKKPHPYSRIPTANSNKNNESEE